MDLSQVVDDVADALVAIDSSGIPFKQFHTGVGPYGEPQLMRAIVGRLVELSAYRGKAFTRRTPDVLISGHWDGSERRAAVVIGYEHSPPQISLEPLFASFEVIASNVVGLQLGPRVQAERIGLVHPIHQQLKVVAWEVLPRAV